MPSYSGLYNGTADVNGGGASGYTVLVDKPPVDRRLYMSMKRRQGLKLQEILKTDAVQNSSGQTALRTIRKVFGDDGASEGVTGPINGGVRTIQNVTIINAATGAATKVDVGEFANVAPLLGGIATDTSGNGSGGDPFNRSGR